MFALALAYADKVAPGNVLARIGERDSANIYYFHVLVGGIIGYFYQVALPAMSVKYLLLPILLLFY